MRTDTEHRSGGASIAVAPDILASLARLGDAALLGGLSALMLVTSRFRTRHELTANEFAVVIQVHDLRRTTSSVLSENIGLSLASTGKLIDTLDRRGWLSRVQDPSDRRRVIVQPTKQLTRNLLELADDMREAAIDAAAGDVVND